MQSLPFDFRPSEKANAERFEGALNNEQFLDPANGTWRDVNHSLREPAQSEPEVCRNQAK